MPVGDCWLWTGVHQHCRILLVQMRCRFPTQCRLPDLRRCVCVCVCVCIWRCAQGLFWMANADPVIQMVEERCCWRPLPKKARNLGFWNISFSPEFYVSSECFFFEEIEKKSRAVVAEPDFIRDGTACILLSLNILFRCGWMRAREWWLFSILPKHRGNVCFMVILLAFLLTAAQRNPFTILENKRFFLFSCQALHPEIEGKLFSGGPLLHKPGSRWIFRNFNLIFQGSYSCFCQTGYVLENGKTCVDFNECRSNM